MMAGPHTLKNMPESACCSWHRRAHSGPILQFVPAYNGMFTRHASPGLNVLKHHILYRWRNCYSATFYKTYSLSCKHIKISQSPKTACAISNISCIKSIHYLTFKFITCKSLWYQWRGPKSYEMILYVNKIWQNCYWEYTEKFSEKLARFM